MSEALRETVRARWFGLHPDDLTATPRHLSDAQGNDLLTEEEASRLCKSKGWQGPHKFDKSEVSAQEEEKP